MRRRRVRFVRRAPNGSGGLVDLRVVHMHPSHVLWWHSHVQPVIDEDETRVDRHWNWILYSAFAYLTGLGTADPKAVNLELTPEALTKYLGDYRYGEGETDGFSVKLNMRKQLSLGKLGKGGGSLYQKAPHVFTYNGTSSVEIRFSVENDQVLSLTVVEPDLTLKARKV